MVLRKVNAFVRDQLAMIQRQAASSRLNISFAEVASRQGASSFNGGSAFVFDPNIVKTEKHEERYVVREQHTHGH